MASSKRTLSAAALLVSATLVLAACSGGEGGSGDGTIELRIAVGGAADNHETEPESPIAIGLSEEIGATVLHEPTPEDLSASLAAGDSPDLFRVDRNQLQTYVDQGLVLDLTPYEDQLGDYVSYVGQETADRGWMDGELAAITPYVNNTNDHTFWIRQDWLDNLDLEAPTTVEEFREVLRAFTEDDPDGNGQNDTYGLTGASVASFAPLWGAFGTPGPGRLYVGDDGQAHASYEDEGMVDAIEYINDIQEAGFVDPDIYTLEGLDARDRGFQGLAGVMAQSWTGVKKEQAAELAVASNPDAEWVQLDLFTQEDGSPSSIAVGTDAAVMYALPATLAGQDEKIQKLIDLINYVSTPEGNEFVMFGVEGTHYERGADDEIVPLPAMAEEGGTFFIYQVSGREEVPYLTAKFPDQQPYWERAHAQEVLVTWEDFIVSPEGYNRADADRFAEDQMIQFLTGQQPVSGYEAFVEKLNDDFGYALFVEAAAEQLDEVGVTG